jgi:hypothetical protein
VYLDRQMNNCETCSVYQKVQNVRFYVTQNAPHIHYNDNFVYAVRANTRNSMLILRIIQNIHKNTLQTKCRFIFYSCCYVKVVINLYLI